VSLVRAWWTLVRLIWWSLLFHVSRRRELRRIYRRRLVRTLAGRIGVFDDDMERLSPMALTCWLGACLAARSAIRYPLRAKRKRIASFGGQTARIALLAAYLAWSWMARDIELGWGAEG